MLSSVPAPAPGDTSARSGTCWLGSVHLCCSVEYPTLGKFKITGVLGEGQFGCVFRAVDTTDAAARPVALKRFFSRLLGPGHVPRIDADAEVAHCTLLIPVKHPHLVNVIQTVPDPGDSKFLSGLALVFELCDSGTLQGLVVKRRAAAVHFSPSEIITLALQLLSGLHAFQGTKLVHNDIAMRNVFITHNPAKQLVFKLGDFGKCHAVPQYGAEVESVQTSPEQHDGRSGSFASDLFSLGVLLFEVMQLDIAVAQYERFGRGRSYMRQLMDEKSATTQRYGSKITDLVVLMIDEQPDLRRSTITLIPEWLALDAAGKSLTKFCCSTSCCRRANS